MFISSTKSGSQRRMLFKLDYFYQLLLHIRKSRFIFAPATHPKALHVLSKTFRPPRFGPALVLRHAGHASATHEELKTESRNKPTEETEPHPSRYDRKGPAGIGTRITRALPACDCTKGPQYRNTDYCERYPHRHTSVTGSKKGRKQPASGERKRL